METIVRGFAAIFILQVIITKQVICQIPSINQPITQYVLSNVGSNPLQYGSNPPQYGSNSPQYVSNSPQYVSNPPQYVSNPQQYGSNPLQYGSNSPQHVSSSPSVQKPNPPLVLPTLATPESTQKAPSVPKTPEITSGPLDTNVLNNLAIALQLLIVSNIMNMPEPEKLVSKLSMHEQPILEQLVSKPLYYETKPGLYSYEVQNPSVYEVQSKPNLISYEHKPSLYEVQSKPSYSYDVQSKPNFYSYDAAVSKPLYYDSPVPNANFLGSSGFSDPVFGSVGTARPNPRSSMTLMSPYDALGSSDPLSSFPSSYKNDFQSPYASILAADGAKDLFSMSNLF